MSAFYSDLEGKSIFLTGASRGIGLAVARALAKNKVKILFNYRGDRKKAEELSQEIEELGGQAIPIEFDLSNSNQLREQAQIVLKDHGELHGLVNNAGIGRDQLLLRLKPEDINDTLQVNLVAAMQLTQVCARYLMKSSPSSIVHISSIVGLRGNAGQSVYAASKAALIGFSHSVARELGKKSVRSNAICPGFIETEMTSGLDENVKKSHQDETPLARFGQVDEVAAAVLFLLSEQSSYITGEVLRVDGGMGT